MANPSARRTALLAAGLLLRLANGAAVGAEDDASPQPNPGQNPPAGAPGVSLDRLLKLPDSYSSRVPPPVRAGATRQEWQARFQKARSDIDAARSGLAQVQKEIEHTASQSNAWQVSAPGQPAPSETSPVSFRLSQEIKRRREALAQAEESLRDLEIQANLAGVPEDWR